MTLALVEPGAMQRKEQSIVDQRSEGKIAGMERSRIPKSGIGQSVRARIKTMERE